MMDDVEALRWIRRQADFLARGVICEAEMANEFVSTVREASLDVADNCLAVLPESVRPIVLGILEDFASRDFYDDRHRFIRDGRTYEERQAYYRHMQPHYRIVCEHLLSRLRCDQPRT